MRVATLTSFPLEGLLRISQRLNPKVTIHTIYVSVLFGIVVFRKFEVLLGSTSWELLVY